MGIIMSALAAAGDEGVKSVDANIKQQMIADQDERRSALETAKAKALIDYQNSAALNVENQKREQRADRINANVPDAVQEAMGKKYAPIDAAVSTADAGQTDAPLTPDQRAVIDSAKQTDYASLAKDPHTYIAAAIRSGDIDPKQVADIAMQEDAIKRQELHQQTQLEHDDKRQDKQIAASESARRASEAFQAGENQKSRDAARANMEFRIMPPADVSDAEKKNWVTTYIRSGGTVPRSAPPWVRNSVGTWAAESGITPADIASGTAQAKFDQASATTSGHRSGAMAGVEAAMPALADNALSLSRRLDQGSFVPLNKLMQMSESQISDPTLAAFKVAHQALVSEYQMVISRGGSNVTSLKEAMHVLDGATNPDAYAAAVNQVKQEVAINVNAMNKVRGNVGGQHAETVPNPVAAPTSNVLTYDPRTGTFH